MTRLFIEQPRASPGSAKDSQSACRADCSRQRQVCYNFLPIFTQFKLMFSFFFVHFLRKLFTTEISNVKKHLHLECLLVPFC